MPTASMTKLIGIGMTSERRSLLKLLTKLGCVQVFESSQYENLSCVVNERYIDEITLKAAKLEFAKNFIKSNRIIAKELIKKGEINSKFPKTNPLAQKPEIEFEQFANAREWESEVFDKIAELEELSTELISLKAEETKRKNSIAQLSIYRDLKVKFTEYADTKHVKIMLGTISKNKLEICTQLMDTFPNLIIETGREELGLIATAIICLKSDYEEIQSRLEEIDFNQCSLRYYDLPANLINDNEIKLKEISFRRNEIVASIIDEYMKPDFTDKCKILEDFYNVEMQKAIAESNMKETEKSCVFQAWIPSELEEFVTKKLDESKLTLYYFTRAVEEGDRPPTLSVNNGVVSPYQSVTNMFDVPSYSEINPNPFVAFFFILFFGMMIGDAGYGVLMTLGTGIVLLCKKPRRNELSLIKILFAGGISTIFWGIMFGGYFGIEQDVIKPILFNPLYDPVSMLLLSLALGLVQMLTGIAINTVQLFKNKQPLDAIFGCFSWYFLIIGIAMFALGGSIAGVKYSGIALLVLGLLGLMLAGAMHKRGIKKVSGAFGKLYGLINFFSDLLSYTRLFGLGLATGVIALVFNNMATVIIGINVVIGAIMAPILLIVGHVFNIAINTLGAYVHNSRLQFVEFFGKFYEGGGYLFQPLGSSMKNYNLSHIKEEKK